MNTKSLATFLSILLLALGVISCSRARSDADITSDVQARIHADNTLAAAPIEVQVSAGVVVLSGTVATDDVRISTENLAREVNGVKDVVNNLQVVAAKSASPVPGQRPTARSKTALRTSERAASVPPVSQQPRGVQQASPAEQVTVPEGTNLSVRLIDPVDTATNKEGDTFRASMNAPVVVRDKTVIPKNADVEARLVSAKSAGHFTGSSSIVLVLTKITVGKKAYTVQTGEFTKKGASRGKRSAAIIGGGAAAGAVIGAIAGGGKGAAIGAAAGAGTGTGVQALTKGEQIKLPAETLLEFQLKSPLTVIPVSGTEKPDTAGD